MWNEARHTRDGAAMQAEAAEKPACLLKNPSKTPQPGLMESLGAVRRIRAGAGAAQAGKAAAEAAINDF